MPIKINKDFGKYLKKSQFPQIFSKFTAIVEEVVCWCLLQNLIHKVGFLSLHTSGGALIGSLEGS